MTKQIYKIRIVTAGLRPVDQTNVIEVAMMNKSQSYNSFSDDTNIHPIWISSHYDDTKLGITQLDKEFERVAKKINYANHTEFYTIRELRDWLDQEN